MVNSSGFNHDGKGKFSYNVAKRQSLAAGTEQASPALSSVDPAIRWEPNGTELRTLAQKVKALMLHDFYSEDWARIMIEVSPKNISEVRNCYEMRDRVDLDYQPNADSWKRVTITMHPYLAHNILYSKPGSEAYNDAVQSLKDSLTLLRDKAHVYIDKPSSGDFEFISRAKKHRLGPELKQSLDKAMLFVKSAGAEKFPLKAYCSALRSIYAVYEEFRPFGMQPYDYKQKAEESGVADIFFQQALTNRNKALRNYGSEALNLIEDYIGFRMGASGQEFINILNIDWSALMSVMHYINGFSNTGGLHTKPVLSDEKMIINRLRTNTACQEFEAILKSRGIENRFDIVADDELQAIKGQQIYIQAPFTQSLEVFSPEVYTNVIIRPEAVAILREASGAGYDNIMQKITDEFTNATNLLLAS